jgi:hypothetical protein
VHSTNERLTVAVIYISHFDHAHVDPTESNFEALGKGVEASSRTTATKPQNICPRA